MLGVVSRRLDLLGSSQPASAARAAVACRKSEPLPSELSDRIEMGRRAVEFVGREPGGLVRVRTEVVPGRRLRGVYKLRSRLIPPIGQARGFGCGFGRRGSSPQSRCPHSPISSRSRLEMCWGRSGIRPRPVRLPPPDHSPIGLSARPILQAAVRQAAPRPLHHRFHSFHIGSSPLRHRRDWEETSIAPVNSPNYAARILVGGTAHGRTPVGSVEIETAGKLTQQTTRCPPRQANQFGRGPKTLVVNVPAVTGAGATKTRQTASDHSPAWRSIKPHQSSLRARCGGRKRGKRVCQPEATQEFCARSVSLIRQLETVNRI